MHISYPLQANDTTIVTEEVVHEYNAKGKVVKTTRTTTTTRTPVRKLPQWSYTYPSWDTGRVWCGSETLTVGSAIN